MMHQDVIVQRLVQDVHDLIRLKSYGLYELVWTLNIDHPELSADQKIDMSLEAVKHHVKEDHLTAPPSSTVQFSAKLNRKVCRQPRRELQT